MRSCKLPSGANLPALGLGTWRMGESVRARAAELDALGKALVVPWVLCTYTALPGVCYWLLVGVWQAPGHTLDFWRVEAFEPGRRLRLAAEMKVPGRAWLEFEVVPDATGTTIHQTAIFDPMGLWGLLYWYALVPVHGFIFGGMLKEIARRAG